MRKASAYSATILFLITAIIFVFAGIVFLVMVIVIDSPDIYENIGDFAIPLTGKDDKISTDGEKDSSVLDRIVEDKEFIVQPVQEGQELGAVAACSDGFDNDNDGFIDDFDLGCFYGNLENAEETQRERTYAYSWREVEFYENIIPFHWLITYRDFDPEFVAEATEKMQEDQRVIFSWDLHRKITGNESDKCINPSAGGLTEYDCVWWDNGVSAVKKEFDGYFKRYKELGGKLDIFVLDFEEGFTNWHLGTTYSDGAFGHYQAIENDPRFSELEKNLSFSNFSLVWDWRSGQSYLEWNALAREMVAGYLNEAIYEPVRKYYPDVKFSNYNDHEYSAEFPVPDFNGHEFYLYGNGAVVGTHQTKSLYGELGGVKDKKLDGQNEYGETEFNAFKYYTNVMRQLRLSSEKPIYPWMSHKEFGQSMLKSSDFYQELVLHVSLSGIDGIMFWNPNVTETPATDYSDNLFSNALKESDFFSGFKDKEIFFEDLASWGSDYVLTGAKISDRVIWRFTPDSVPSDIKERIIKKDGGKVVLLADGKELVFSDAMIYELPESVSSQGLWIAQKGIDKPVFLSPREGYSGIGKANAWNLLILLAGIFLLLVAILFAVVFARKHDSQFSKV